MVRTLLALALLATLSAAPAAAQQQTARPKAMVVATPTVANARVGVRASYSTLEPATPQPLRQRRYRNGVPQMIVGGAALVVGALIGDQAGTIVMVGGAGFGLYGLWLYLK